MLDPKQLRQYVIEPVCKHLQLYSPAAVELLLGTAAQESGGLRFIHQLGSGPAIGLPQMEPATHDDIWANFLRYKPDLKEAVTRLSLVNMTPGWSTPSDQMHGNLYYAFAMFRVQYFRQPAALPMAGDVSAMARYWKQYYNTLAGAGTEKEYRDNWAKLQPYL